MTTLIYRLSRWVKKFALNTIAMIMLLSGPAVDRAYGAAQVLDQSFPLTSSVNPSGDEYQTLTVGISGQLTQADVFLTALNDAPSMEIYSADSSGNLLTALTAAAIQVPFFSSGPPLRISVDLTAENIHVQQGDVIAIVLREDNRPVFNEFNYGWTWAFHHNPSPGPTYELGKAYAEFVDFFPGIPQLPQGLRIVDREGDYGFETFVVPVPEPLAVHVAMPTILGLLSLVRRKRVRGFRRLSISSSRRMT